MNTTEPQATSAINGKKILLSTIGSRGDIQPLIALALTLKQHGAHPLLAAGPNLKEFVNGFGLEFTSNGPDLVKLEKRNHEGIERTEAEIAEGYALYMREAFSSAYQAAQHCDMFIAGGVTNHAGRSVAEALNIPFACLAYCPAVIPAPNHPPPRMILRQNQQAQKRPKSVNKSLWKSFEKEQNDTYLELINQQRKLLNLAPIDNVHRFSMSDQPWLAADKTLGPAAKVRGILTHQVGPLLLEDTQPLSDEIEAFLQNGPAPIYVGFGSMIFVGSLTGEQIVDACRQSGYRAIIYRGWAELDIPQDDDNILVIGDHNQSKLFPRVAAVIHHGGAGTTTVAAVAGVPQIIIPRYYDQFYWAHRIQELGIGMTCRSAYSISVDALVGAIKELVTPQRAARASEVSKQIELQGAQNTAKLIAAML